MNVVLSLGLQKNIVMGMIDSRADVTICSSLVWPKHWPLICPGAGITGIGGSLATYLRAQVVTLNLEGKTASIKVYVMALRASLQMLIGRDVLSQLGVMITTEEKDFP